MPLTIEVEDVLLERLQRQAAARQFAFPADLPNLAALRPPDGNVRADGVAQCFFEQRGRGELAGVY